ncbi:MAG TPA: PIG-L family deacetylase [Planctomycetota bacterium]|nr:PIG-L family deacetylase [Planctomycetota bacterium]
MSDTLRILALGAHPDDCEWACGGTAAQWAAQGHRVKFVSLTNGDLGHWKTVGPTLAARRRAEVARAAEILGVASEVLPTPDGTLTPSLEMRRTVARVIREYRPDIVLTHRPNDYHPDHRAAGALVQDCAYLVTIPHYIPEAPALDRNPLFLHFEDEFTRPTAFQADVVVAIDDVWEKKLAALEAMESQGLEGGCEGGPDTWPADEAGRRRRAETVRSNYRAFFEGRTRRHRARLEETYGAGAAGRIKVAEAFEICEYSASWAAFSKTARRPDGDELRRLFPR